jgi:hypothetical protein
VAPPSGNCWRTSSWLTNRHGLRVGDVRIGEIATRHPRNAHGREESRCDRTDLIRRNLPGRRLRLVSTRKAGADAGIGDRHTRGAGGTPGSAATRVRDSRKNAPAFRQPQHFPLVDDRDRTYFGQDACDQDHIGHIDANTRAIFGPSYAAEPDALVKELATDEAIAAADTLLLTVPNTLGVDYNAHVIERVLKYVAPELG